MPTIAPGFTQGSCTNVTKVTLNQADIVKLRGLVSTALIGNAGDPNDGLADKVRAASIQGKRGMGYEAMLVGEWAFNNKATYQRFAEFKLIPKVAGCKSTNPQGTVLCTSIDAAKGLGFDVSPDFYSNLVYLSQKLSDPAVTSLSYYLYDAPRPHCGFFSQHYGTLVFADALSRTCPAQ